MKAKFTQTHARNILPGSVRFSCRDGEYRLTYTAGAIKAMKGHMPVMDVWLHIESSAYYSCDLTDIVNTGHRMHDDYCTAIYDASKKESN